jgi:hypothetical protein
MEDTMPASLFARRALIFGSLALALASLPAAATDGDPACAKARDEWSSLQGMGVNAELRDQRAGAAKGLETARKGRDVQGYEKALGDWKKATTALLNREREQATGQQRMLEACAPARAGQQKRVVQGPGQQKRVQ